MDNCQFAGSVHTKCEAGLPSSRTYPSSSKTGEFFQVELEGWSWPSAWPGISGSLAVGAFDTLSCCCDSSRSLQNRRATVEPHPKKQTLNFEQHFGHVFMVNETKLKLYVVLQDICFIFVDSIFLEISSSGTRNLGLNFQPAL